MSISPNVPNPQESYHYETSGTPRWIVVLFVVLFAALAVLGYAGHSVQSRMDQDLTKTQEQNKVLTAQLEQANSRIADLKGHLEVTEQKVGMSQAEIAKATSRAEAIRKEQVASGQKLAAQLTEVQKESSEKIGAVATEVGGAKKDIEATKSDLEATKRQARTQPRRHERHERLDRPQSRRPRRPQAQGGPQLLRIHSYQGQVSSARRSHSNESFQDRSEKIQVHPDRLRRRPPNRKER